MGLLNFKCKKCGTKVSKIHTLKDIFLIKRGKVIECKQCSAQYSVPKIVQKIGSLYHYLFIGGFIAIIWLFLTVLLDNIFGKEIANAIGIWIWAISAVIYVFIEAIIALLLPLKEISEYRKVA